MSSGKTFPIYIPGELVDSFTAAAESKAHGNFARYVQDLHRAAENQTGIKASSNDQIILELARHLHPTLREPLEKLLKAREPVDQQRVAARFLEALLSALQENINPEEPFHFDQLDTKSAIETAVSILIEKHGLSTWLGRPELDPNKVPNSPVPGLVRQERESRKAAQADPHSAKTTRAGKSIKSPYPEK